MKYYNRSSPPDYDLSKVRVCQRIYYSENDVLAGIKDVKRLLSELPCGIERKVTHSNFNHLDFLLSKTAKEYVYDQIIADVLDYESKWCKK